MAVPDEPNPNIDRREDHYERFFGPISQPVLHSTDTMDPHVDIYQFPPLGMREHWTLVTGGMSDRRQEIPPDLAGALAPRSELILYADKPDPWMFRALKQLAEYPFQEETYLHFGHTVDGGGPVAPTPCTLTAFLVWEPVFEEDPLAELLVEGDRVDFLWVVPLTAAELAFKLEHGSMELVKRFEETGLDPVVDTQRPSVV